MAPTPLATTVLFVPATLYNPAPAATAPAAKAPAEASRVDAAASQAALAEARAAVDAGEVSAALRHAARALTFDPASADAARLLGYQRVGESWAGGYAAKMAASGHAWDSKFGWVKREQLAKFQAGQRPFGGRWISADDDARRHTSIDRGWAVRTDHFLVTTNIDRAAGIELASRLEAVYLAWQQLFGEFAVTPAELRTRLAGKERSGYQRKPFRVTYHRNRQEYNDALRRDQPQIEITLGIYFDAKRESHFFAGADQDPGTIVHEAVHQLFYESAPQPARHLAATANVWAVEGVACYFESLVERPLGERGVGRCFTLGTPEAGRLPAARHRRVVDGYYVPLAELAALGMTDLQARPDLPRLYSQSAGLATFLMEAEGSRYRRAFRELLLAIYAGRDAPDKLAVATGRSYDQLDAEYYDYLQELPVTAVIAPSEANP